MLAMTVNTICIYGEATLNFKFKVDIPNRYQKRQSISENK